MNRIKALIFIIGIWLIPGHSFSQNGKITDKEWDVLIQSLENEKWESAENTLVVYLKKFSPTDDSLAEPAILRYMYLRCLGARLGEKEYSKTQALKKAKVLVGKTVLTPPTQYFAGGTFNCFTLNDDSTRFFLCGSNTKNTVIHTFENYQFQNPQVINNAIQEKYVNTELKVGATIAEIDAGGEFMPRLEIKLVDAFIWEETTPK